MLPVWLQHVPLDEGSPARVLLEVGRELGRLEAIAAAYASDPLNNLPGAPAEKDGSAGQSVDQAPFVYLADREGNFIAPLEVVQAPDVTVVPATLAEVEEWSELRIDGRPFPPRPTGGGARR